MASYECNEQEFLGNDFERDFEIQEMEEIVRPSMTYWQDAFRRLKENKVAMASAVILVLLMVMTVIGPYLTPYTFTEIHAAHLNEAPTAAFWFGTDSMGRDLFTRVWIGGRVSMIIGLVGAVVNIVIGLLYGGFSGYFGGRVDMVMMRIVEIIGCVPKMLVIILVSLILKPGIPSLIIALTIAGWTGTARMVRGQILQLKELDFVTASVALGSSPWEIIKEHLIPNVMSTIIILTTISVPGLMFSEAFLSFIGLGVQSPNTSWGAMCSEAQQVILFYPYQLLFPTLMISLTMLCFNLLGDGLRDALDPKLRK